LIRRIALAQTKGWVRPESGAAVKLTPSEAPRLPVDLLLRLAFRRTAYLLVAVALGGTMLLLLQGRWLRANSSTVLVSQTASACAKR
jgi:hypothetical protein